MKCFVALFSNAWPQFAFNDFKFIFFKKGYSYDFADIESCFIEMNISQNN